MPDLMMVPSLGTSAELWTVRYGDFQMH